MMIFDQGDHWLPATMRCRTRCWISSWQTDGWQKGRLRTRLKSPKNEYISFWKFTKCQKCLLDGFLGCWHLTWWGLEWTWVVQIWRFLMLIQRISYDDSLRWMKLESKQQSKEWRYSYSPPPRKAKVVTSAGQIMASVFWDAEGVLLIDYLSKGSTVTGQYYSDLLWQLREQIKVKRRGKLSRGVIFHHDNAPVHKSAVAMSAIHHCGFQLMEHPPYSPDLAPSDFHLFPQLKRHLGCLLYTSPSPRD